MLNKKHSKISILFIMKINEGVRNGHLTRNSSLGALWQGGRDSSSSYLTELPLSSEEFANLGYGSTIFDKYGSTLEDYIKDSLSEITIKDSKNKLVNTVLTKIQVKKDPPSGEKPTTRIINCDIKFNKYLEDDAEKSFYKTLVFRALNNAKVKYNDVFGVDHKKITSWEILEDSIQTGSKMLFVKIKAKCERIKGESDVKDAEKEANKTIKDDRVKIVKTLPDGRKVILYKKIKESFDRLLESSNNFSNEVKKAEEMIFKATGEDVKDKFQVDLGILENKLGSFNSSTKQVIIDYANCCEKKIEPYLVIIHELLHALDDSKFEKLTNEDTKKLFYFQDEFDGDLRDKLSDLIIFLGKESRNGDLTKNPDNLIEKGETLLDELEELVDAQVSSKSKKEFIEWYNKKAEIIFDTIVYNAFGGHTPEWMRYKRLIDRMFKVEIPLAID